MKKSWMLFLFFAAFAALTFSGCSDDDNSDAPENTHLVSKEVQGEAAARVDDLTVQRDHLVVVAQLPGHPGGFVDAVSYTHLVVDAADEDVHHIALVFLEGLDLLDDGGSIDRKSVV